MKKEELAQKIKEVVENDLYSYTNTSKKKGEAFTIFNGQDIKFGKVELTETRLRVILHLIPQKYSLGELVQLLHIPIRKKGSRYTGMFLQESEDGIANYDTIEISLYSDYFSPVNQANVRSLLQFVKAVTAESGFKSGELKDKKA
ncbi:hypothetical protein [Evansella halocellulosilytica]|uniref:hypothetical protein n=1 Tax=Evansella halocellulosilytica TaxID=2011013 RepID=UPI000BB8CC6F|nr:hypothetical protein [Evansella halocellulosilytica]